VVVFLRKYLVPGVLFLVGLGFDLSPRQSDVFAYLVWAVAAIWVLYGAWPTLKRWRPFTLAPAQDDSPSGAQPASANAARSAEPATAPDRQDEHRKRIEHWRSVINSFDFDKERFAATDTYSQLRPHLQPEVIEMFEAQRTVHVGNEARGDTAYKYTLLDEVARIENEGVLSAPESANNEGLKRRCRELADKLFQFVKDRGHGEVVLDDPDEPEMLRRNDETIGLYRRHFEGEVMALYEVLKQRGLWGEEILDPLGRNRLEAAYFGDIRAIAQRLSAIGHRL
jgi:hypothetical protein